MKTLGIIVLAAVVVYTARAVYRAIEEALEEGDTTPPRVG